MKKKKKKSISSNSSSSSSRRRSSSFGNYNYVVIEKKFILYRFSEIALNSKLHIYEL